MAKRKKQNLGAKLTERDAQNIVDQVSGMCNRRYKSQAEKSACFDGADLGVSRLFDLHQQKDFVDDSYEVGRKKKKGIATVGPPCGINDGSS